MRIQKKKDELERELKEAKDQQERSIITIQEEKELIKRIADIERSLPFAGLLD